MNRREFLYFLTTESGASYYIDNGVVKSTPAELKPLDHAPSGWKDKLINFSRNTTYYGVFRSFTIPMKFVKEGARILRERMFKQGIEDVVNLIILRLNKTSGKHEGFYKGEIDFAKFSSNKDFYQVNVLEGGFPKYLKAYETTMFEFPMTGNGIVNVKMDGLKLRKRINFRIYNSDITSDIHSLPCVMINEEGTSFGILPGDSNFVQGINVATNEDSWILNNVGDTAVEVKLEGFIQASLQSGGGNNVLHYYIKAKKDTGGEVIIYDHTGTVIGGGFPFDGIHNVNATITVNPGEKLFLISDVDGTSGLVQYGWGEITVTFTTKFKTTYIKAIKAKVLADLLLKKMATPDYTLISFLLDNSDIYLTCGDAIRGIEEAKIKTCWKDYYLSFNRRYCLGLGYNGFDVTIDKRKEYYKNVDVHDLGEINDAEFVLDEGLVFNKIKIGYANQNYDDVNGREEFNNTHEYKCPITRIIKELDLTAPYRADMYGIEFLRINLDGKTTTDNSGDNDVFMLVVEPDPDSVDGSFRLKRDTYDAVPTGLIDPESAFNVQLSVKRCFEAHGSWIRGCMWPYTGKKITFQTSPKNSLLRTVQNGKVIQENADVLIGDLEENYFVPILAKFETVVPKNLLAMMLSNSYGLFKFTYRGKVYKGWCIECKQKPAGDAAQDWVLLLSKDNDLNGLIHG